MSNTLFRLLGVLTLRALLVVLTGIAFTHSVQAEDEIVLQFQKTPTVATAVIRLADLVEVVTGEAPSLIKLLESPIGPAPRLNSYQNWSSEEVLMHLELRGVHRSSVRWKGSPQALLRAIEKPVEAEDISVPQPMMVPAFVDERIIQQADANVALAISEYLNLRTGERTDWLVAVDVPDQYAQLLMSRRSITSIGGGVEPWLGKQAFELKLKSRDGLIDVRIVADVALPPLVVTASRAIRRDEILNADSLTYAALPSRNATDQKKHFFNIDELLGKQVRRSISNGLPITAEFIGPPIVVQRNDLVDIESVAGSIVVRSSGRAMDSGSVGDLIEV